MARTIVSAVSPIILLLILYSSPVRTAPTSPDYCKEAFTKCNFGFDGVSSPALFDHRAPEKAFTPDIVHKDEKKFIGIAVSNIEGEFIDVETGKVVPFSQAIPSKSGVQAFNPTVFRPYFPSINGMHTGIGHEVFQSGQGDYAQGKCVRVYLTDYQVLKKKNGFKTVVGKVTGMKDKSKNNCVVFRTSFLL